MDNKWIYRFSVLVILSAQIAMGVTAFWLLYPYDPISISEPIPIETKEIKKGESVVYEANYCWRGDYPIKIDRRVIGEIEYPFPSVRATSTKGCYNQLLATPAMPQSIPSGEYVLKLTGLYQVNPIREISVELFSEPFIIHE